MVRGKDLGLQLRAWLADDPAALASAQVITNRLLDLLGADESLKGPIRDLASQPLLLQALRLQGASQRSALVALNQQLSRTYSPAVLAELLELLEAATGVALPRPPAAASAGEAHPDGATNSATTAAAGSERAGPAWPQRLQAFGPGMALAASGALVLAWAGQELDQRWFDRWGWSGGVVLVLLLGLLQALAVGPLKRLRRLWPLSHQLASDPQQAWRWLTAPWVHGSGVEAAINLLLLLLLLGASPLSLADVVLRYSLTGLATLAPAAWMAARFGVERRWSGASGAISALIALAAGLSLLHWRPLSLGSGALLVPAWVLLIVYGALQLGWQLPRQAPEEASQPLQRLLSCQWSWGLLLGLAWALVSWAGERMQPPAA